MVGFIHLFDAVIGFLNRVKSGRMFFFQEVLHQYREGKLMKFVDGKWIEEKPDQDEVNEFLDRLRKEIVFLPDDGETKGGEA